MRINGLTARQYQVAEMIAAGKTDKEIADTLHIGKQGVWYHIRVVARRLGVHGGNTRVRIALRMHKVPEHPAA